MHAHLLSIHSPDVDDLAAHRPEDSAFTIALQLFVGPSVDPTEGEESFQLTVCSPDWLRSAPQPVVGRHLLIVNDFRFADVARFIEERVTACSGFTWSEVAEKVSRLGYWEFEDYKARPAN